MVILPKILIMVAIIEENLRNIERICKEKNVAKLYTFGSVNTDKFNEESDIDLLVEFKDLFNDDYADNYLDMCYELEDILKRKVDLVTTKSVKNPVFKDEIESSRQLIYQD